MIPTPIPRAEPGTALLLDAAGTLLRPAEPVAHTYAEHAHRLGIVVSAATIAARLGPAIAAAEPLRIGAADWREFWAVVVERCTDSDDPRLLDGLIAHYAEARAWTIAPGARSCCERVRTRGMKVAVISNWDRHLRPLLDALGVLAWIDELVVSGEEGASKPDRVLFERACARLGVSTPCAVHVGDDERADLAGASAAGCAALLFGRDVASFDALAELLLPADGGFSTVPVE